MANGLALRACALLLMAEIPEGQLAKRFAGFRQGWFYILCTVALSLARKWLVSRASERPQFGASRDRRALARDQERRSQPYQPGGRQRGEVCQQRRSGTGAQEWILRRSGNRHTEANFAPDSGASEAEMGLWHFGGRHRWVWMHDGKKPNGWVEFGTDGVARTSFICGGRGKWDLRSDGKMLLTFGKCQHMLELLPETQGEPPAFEVRERLMKDGSASRKRQGGSPTRGRLQM